MDIIYIPFIMQPGKTIDQEKLKKGGYNVAIVFLQAKTEEISMELLVALFT